MEYVLDNSGLCNRAMITQYFIKNMCWQQTCLSIWVTWQKWTAQTIWWVQYIQYLLKVYYYYFFIIIIFFNPKFFSTLWRMLVKHLKQVEATDICQIGLELIIEIISHKCRKQLIYSGNWYLLIFQFGYLKDIFSIFYSFWVDENLSVSNRCLTKKLNF